MRLLYLIIAAALACSATNVPAQPGPVNTQPEKEHYIGIQYLTWFDAATLDDVRAGCAGSGWADNPFLALPRQAASLVFGPQPNGTCYSSREPQTATVHAGYLDMLKVDFIVIDETNLSTSKWPENNFTYQASKRTVEGLQNYNAGRTNKIRAVYQLSMACWASLCFPDLGLPPQMDVYNYNDFVKAHIEDIATRSLASPDDFFQVNGKPLLLFYISGGSSVKNLDGTPAFHGPGNIAPTPGEFNPVVQVNGVNRALRDVFTVRYTVASLSPFDYTPFSADVWPFFCPQVGCKYSEAAYASLYALFNFDGRSDRVFNGFLEAGLDKKYLIVRVWNEFSSTDERLGRAYTLEPNTIVHLYDTTPGNMDPWYYFVKVRDLLSAWAGIPDVARRVVLRGPSGFDGNWENAFSFGLPGDTPFLMRLRGVDGSVRKVPVVWRPGEANWYIDRAGFQSWTPETTQIVQFGLPGDIPRIVYWKGEDRIAVQRAGQLLINSNNESYTNGSNVVVAPWPLPWAP